MTIFVYCTKLYFLDAAISALFLCKNTKWCNCNVVKTVFGRMLLTWYEKVRNYVKGHGQKA